MGPELAGAGPAPRVQTEAPPRVCGHRESTWCGLSLPQGAASWGTRSIGPGQEALARALCCRGFSRVLPAPPAA